MKTIGDTTPVAPTKEQRGPKDPNLVIIGTKPVDAYVAAATRSLGTVKYVRLSALLKNATSMCYTIERLLQMNYTLAEIKIGPEEVHFSDGETKTPLTLQARVAVTQQIVQEVKTP